MQISLKPSLQQFVDEKVKAGQYVDASQVVNEALEILKEQEDFAPNHEAYLRRELERGLEQLEHGQISTADAEQIIAEERQRIKGND